MNLKSAIILSSILFFQNICLSEDSPKPRLITSSETSTEKIPATLAKITIGSEGKGPTAQAAQNELSKINIQVLAALKNSNVPQPKITNMYLNQEYSYESSAFGGSKPKLIGYFGQTFFNFEVPINDAGKIIDACISAGATKIQGIEYSANDAEIDAARERALKKAATAAKKKALSVLQELGYQGQEVVSIVIGEQANTYGPPIAMQAVERSVSAAGAQTQVAGGDLSIQGSVTVQVGY